MKKVYCEYCKEYVEYSVRKNIIESYKECNVNVVENIAVCECCQNDIFVEELENENLIRLYDKYRKINNMVTKEEIISFRDKYEISQRDLTSILGWGKMTINRYEKGALANKSHNDLLKIVLNDENRFFEMVRNAYDSGRLTKKKYDTLSSKMEDNSAAIYKALINSALSHEENILNGFRQFDIERTQTLISYIADVLDGVYKTSLNKLLFYIDFICYKELSRGVTGLQYIKYTYGPVIEKHYYNNLIYNLSEQYEYDERETADNTITIIKSLKNYDLSKFNASEVSIINKVLKVIGRLSATQISELSHKEIAWRDRKISEYISYDYADKIKITY